MPFINHHHHYISKISCRSFVCQQQQGSQQRSFSQSRDIFSSQNQNQSQSRDSQNRELFSSQNQNIGFSNQNQNREVFSSQNQGREQGLFSQQSSSSHQISSSHQQISNFSSSSQVEQNSSFSSGQYQLTSGQSAASQSHETVETVKNVTSMSSFESVQSVSSEQRQSLKEESNHTSEFLESESKFSSADQKSSVEKISSDGQIGSLESTSDASSPYNLPPQVSARSLLSELEAPPSPLLINNNNNNVGNNSNTTMSPGATPWAPASSTATGPELSLSSPPTQPLNLGTPLGGLEQPGTNSPASSSSGFQLQRPRQFQPSPATARRILPPSPASQSPAPQKASPAPQKASSAPQKSSPAPQKSSPAPQNASPAPKRNSPPTSSSSELAVQFGQQKEVKFNSVSSISEQRRVENNNNDESKSGAVSSRDSKSRSKEAQSGQLAHAICNMTETLASFKATLFIHFHLLEILILMRILILTSYF